jgi:hypothetical protein
VEWNQPCNSSTPGSPAHSCTVRFSYFVRSIHPAAVAKLRSQRLSPLPESKETDPPAPGVTSPALQLGGERSRRGLSPVARAHNRAPRVQRSIVARVGSRGKGGIPPFPGNPSLGAEWAAQYATFRESNPSPLLFAFLQSLQVQVLSVTRDLQLLTPFLRAPGLDLE